GLPRRARRTTLMLDLVFWLAAGAVAYTWVGYPLALAVVTVLAAPPRRRRNVQPHLSVIIAAYNEAKVIEAKIASVLDQRYPPESLEVIVVSDGSTDGTDARALGYGDPRVILIRQEPRAGKAAALNRGVAVASGDVLVFTDANALFAPNALARLATLLGDPRVGLVSGQGLYAPAGTGDGRAVGNGYVRYEASLKRGESALGFLAGADGAIYALRRELYEPLRAADVNDLLHPIQAALAGFMSRFDPDAYTVEPASAHAGQEFRRHVRIIAQNMELLAVWLPGLLAARRWRAVWALASHRVLRWATAPLLAIALIANAALLGQSALYGATLAAQLGFYALALVGFLGERRGVALGRLAIPYYFCVVTAAGLAALLRWRGHGAQAVWAPQGTGARDRAA
ncbi:MAG: glycosyltransferase family 2 protein, partial [Candidatus Rokuibacteriota bacterium]